MPPTIYTPSHVSLHEGGGSAEVDQGPPPNGARPLRWNDNMIPRECRRLAEVDFPIAEVSRHAGREKSIRHGHPSTLHLWWARRPLASSRAVLLALLLPDPCDSNCPDVFKEEARTALLGMHGRPGGWETLSESDEGLRQTLLKFIAAFANWDVASNADYVTTAQALVRAAHPDAPPLVVDPFAGGGSIPLEALRLGCEAFASDLNPVACLILKVMLEMIPRRGRELANDVRRAGAEIRTNAAAELAELYPRDPDGSTPIAYLWARTVRCEAPRCGAEIPLLGSFWLARTTARRRALRAVVLRPAGRPPEVRFDIFEPETNQEVANRNIAGARATCLCCGSTLLPERVRAQLAAQQGGADVRFDDDGNRVGGARITAVVTLNRGETGRRYRVPTEADYVPVRIAQERVGQILQDWAHRERQGLRPVPDEPLPPIGTLGFRVQRYGMVEWGQLSTARQKLALITVARLTASVDAQPEPLSLAFSRLANASASLCRWNTSGEKHEGVYARNALPILWDFSEANPLSQSTGSYSGAVEWVAKVLEAWPSTRAGQVQQADATDHPLPDESTAVWFTDPPYYDAIPYADLSDFFLVWLKRALPADRLPIDPFDRTNTLSPKIQEAVQDEKKKVGDRNKDRAWFEDTMATAFAQGRNVLSEDGIGSVVFAHSTTEGWEALLSGLIRGGWTITGSWPIATEMGSRLRARDSAALATSIHLVCRPRPNDAPVGDWAGVLRELPARVGDWMERLQREGIRGADLVFSCVGPALEVFSRYRHVETPEGAIVGLPAYLEKVWEVVGREALEQVLGTAEAQARNGAAGALEEDARLTALFLWTLQSTATNGVTRIGSGTPDTDDTEGRTSQDDERTQSATGFKLPFDVARRFAQPLGIHLPEWESRIIETRQGSMRLLPVMERSRQLFGQGGAATVAEEIESNAEGSAQLVLFPETTSRVQDRGGRRRRAAITVDLDSPLAATTLDRVHAAMLLQASGHSTALRTLLEAEHERGPDFRRLANALSALYPRGSEEKRLLDAMLLATPR